jgi:hypothetical protein
LKTSVQAKEEEGYDGFTKPKLFWSKISRYNVTY